jgi:hypothetical protein
MEEGSGAATPHITNLFVAFIFGNNVQKTHSSLEVYFFVVLLDESASI